SFAIADGPTELGEQSALRTVIQGAGVRRETGRSGETGPLRRSSQGTKTLLFMPVAFSDDPAAPLTQAGAYDLMNQVNQWYVEDSYNTTAIISDVTPLLILPQTKAYYNGQGVGVFQSAARAAALAA